MKSEPADIIVVGAGPAGIAACLEAIRLGLFPSLVSDGPVGGLVNAARRLDNIPGFPAGIPGPEWSRLCGIQLDLAGIRPITATVHSVEKIERDFLITTSGGNIMARAVVLAVGTRPKPHSSKLSDYPAIRRDAANLPACMTGLRTAVVGSGEAAVDTAMNLFERGASVFLFSRADAPRACGTLLAELRSSNVNVLTRAVVSKVTNARGVVRLQFEKGPEWNGNIAIFCVGRESRLDEIRLVCPPDTPGIMTAGDMNRTTDRYVLPAMADGRAAACAAYQWIIQGE